MQIESGSTGELEQQMQPESCRQYPIESGATRERKVRTLLMLVMLGVFSVWFAYDGLIGYPADNVDEHVQQLPADLRESARGMPIYPAVTAQSVPKAKEALGKIGRDKQLAALEELYGGPPSFQMPDAYYYFGPTCGIKAVCEGSQISQIISRATDHTDTDIFYQKLIGLVLGVLTVYRLWVWVGVLRTRLVLDDRGLSYNGKGPIPWDDMRLLKTDDFQKKGWVDLLYDDDGAQKRLRLDEYHVAKFEDVIDVICAKKAFENPLPVKQSDVPSTST